MSALSSFPIKTWQSFVGNGSEEVNEIFEILPNIGNNYDTAVTKLIENFSPTKNTEIEEYKFRQANQEAGETIDTYHTRLQKLSLTCE